MSDIVKQTKTLREIQETITEIKNHLITHPKDYTKMFALAQYYYLLEEYRNCSEICHKLADLGAEQVDVYSTGVRADVQSGYFKEAIKIAEQGLKIFPDHLNLNLYYSHALTNVSRYKDAEDINEKIMSLGSVGVEYFISMSSFYLQNRDLKRAAEVTQKGLVKYPDNANLLNNMGNIFIRSDSLIEGTEYYLAALRSDPQNLSALINIGSSMERLRSAYVAEQFFDQALEMDPHNGVALCSKAGVMANHGKAQEAMPLFEEGLEFIRNSAVKNTMYTTHSSNYIFFQHYVPNRSIETLVNNIKNFNKESCVDIIEKPSLEFENEASKNKKLRVGLISKGFRVHPVGQMIYQALKHIDKSQFSLYCYTELPEDNKDYLTEMLYREMDKVIGVDNVLNHNVVERMREDEIDILIEMTGHSEGGRRLQMIAERAAPVQVKWVGGLFNTSGLKQMDWLITDHIETPEGVDKWYTEKLYRMPDDYIVYNPPTYAPDVKSLPASTNGYVTFGNLNNLAKTNSYSIELWSKVMHAVPGSKILFKGNRMHEEFAQDHIHTTFEKFGITRDRVIIEGAEMHQKFLDVYNRIDIALDPHPYTGGLTTCEALWMGVPVVTLPSETFAGRHAATHLTNAAMPEWIAQNEEDYIDIAVKWANDIDGLAKLRSGMREHVSKTPLVDGPRFAKNLEIALRHMWSEWCDAKEAANKPKKVSKPKPKKSKKRK
ncbi:MAG: hypothetical protein CMH27_10620 [Micavibrio sp.]|nr:hypothetical protein [Micavibrio sp.]|tara:strand:- start:2449 stop:4599 length:2151 start_codon:yes stop_codon:yes gene_type:complete